MTLISDLLPVIDELDGLFDDFGLRPFSVTRRVITYSGERVGDGAATTVDTPITVAGGRRPEVEELRDTDVVAGGVLSTTRYKVGPLVPAYPGGGTDTETLDPPAGAQPSELFFIVRGQGLPAAGVLCKKVGEDFSSAYELFITLEALGQEAP